MQRVVNRFAELLAIKERRDGRSYSRRDIEALTGISTTSIQNWYHNRNTQYSTVQIDAFAKFFGVTPGDLFMWEESSKEESPESSGQEKTLLAAS